MAKKDDLNNVVTTIRLKHDYAHHWHDVENTENRETEDVSFFEWLAVHKDRAALLKVIDQL